MSAEIRLDRDDALVLANEVRLLRAEVKRAVKAGEMSFADALDCPALGSMKVADLLQCIPRIGAARAEELLGALRVDPQRICGELSHAEAIAIVLELGRRLARRERGGAPARIVLHAGFGEGAETIAPPPAPERGGESWPASAELAMARAEALAALRDGRVGLQRALHSEPLADAPVLEVVSALSYVGEARGRLILREAGIEPWTPCCGLGSAERARLVHVVALSMRRRSRRRAARAGRRAAAGAAPSARRRISGGAR